MDRDGVAEIVTANGPQAEPRVHLLNLVKHKEIDDFFAFGAGFRGGVFGGGD